MSLKGILRRDQEAAGYQVEELGDDLVQITLKGKVVATFTPNATTHSLRRTVDSHREATHNELAIMWDAFRLERGGRRR